MIKYPRHPQAGLAHVAGGARLIRSGEIGQGLDLHATIALHRVRLLAGILPVHSGNHAVQTDMLVCIQHDRHSSTAGASRLLLACVLLLDVCHALPAVARDLAMHTGRAAALEAVPDYPAMHATQAFLAEQLEQAMRTGMIQFALFLGLATERAHALASVWRILRRRILLIWVWQTHAPASVWRILRRRIFSIWVWQRNKALYAFVPLVAVLAILALHAIQPEIAVRAGRAVFAILLEQLMRAGAAFLAKVLQSAMRARGTRFASFWDLAMRAGFVGRLGHVSTRRQLKCRACNDLAAFWLKYTVFLEVLRK